jgi:transposase-like protein
MTLSFENLSPEGRQVVQLYLDGVSYKEIAERLRVERQFAYGVIHRQVSSGALKPRKKPERIVRRQILETVRIGRVGKALDGLSPQQLLVLCGKMKRGETLSDALVRIALSR